MLGHSINHPRWRAFYTWGFGAFHIGWDLGQGLLNFLPQGAIGLLIPIEPSSKLFELPTLLNRFLLGPLLGVVFAAIGLFPALIEGLIFKRPYKKINDQWATGLVNRYGTRLFWGGGLLSVIASIGIVTGYLPIAFNTAFTLPLMLSYGVIALSGIASLLHNIYGSMLKLYAYRTKSIGWDYTLKSLVNITFDDPEIKDKLNEEFRYETDFMSQRYDEAYALLVQRDNEAPTSDRINSLQVLTQYGLQKDQSDFITSLRDNPKYKPSRAKLNAIDERHQSFENNYKAKLA